MSTSQTHVATLDDAIQATEQFFHAWLCGQVKLPNGKQSDNYAKEHGIKPSQFRIVLSGNAKNDMVLLSGPVVQIVLSWPKVKPTVTTYLKRAMRYMERMQLTVGFDIGSQHIMSQIGRTVIWKKQPFDDLADLDPDVLPLNSFSVQHKHSVTLKHKNTGILHTVTDQTGTRSQWDMIQECRLVLSRIVKRFEDERLERMIPKSHALVPMWVYEETKAELHYAFYFGWDIPSFQFNSNRS